MALAAFSPALAAAAGVRTETLAAWNEYIRGVEQRTQKAASAGPFLWIDTDPERAAKVGRGEIVTAGSAPKAVPYGLIHDWVGAIFIPGVPLAQVFDVIQDYDRYSYFYGPGVVDAALLCRGGRGNGADEERFRIRYSAKVLFVSEILESEYTARQIRVDPQHWYSIARSDRVRELHGAETQDPGTSGQPSRYIWRIYTIMKFEHKDGGVYVEQENIVLSRAVPNSLEWLVGPAIRRLSRDVTATALRETRLAVLAARAGAPSMPLPAGSE